MDQKNDQPWNLSNADLTPTLNNFSTGRTNSEVEHTSQRMLRKVTVNLKDIFDRIRTPTCVPKCQMKQRSTEEKAESKINPSKTATNSEAGSSANTNEPTNEVQIISSVKEIIDVEAEWNARTQSEGTNNLPKTAADSEAGSGANTNEPTNGVQIISSVREIIDVEAEWSTRAQSEETINPPNGVANIEAGSITNNANPEEINPPNTVTDIEAGSITNTVNQEEINPPNGVADIEAGSITNTVEGEEINQPNGVRDIEASPNAHDPTNEEEADVALLEMGMASNPNNVVELSDADEDHRQYLEETRLRFQVTLENLINDPDPFSPHMEEMAFLIRFYPANMIPENVLDYFFGNCCLHRNMTTYLAPLT